MAGPGLRNVYAFLLISIDRYQKSEDAYTDFREYGSLNDPYSQAISRNRYARHK